MSAMAASYSGSTPLFGVIEPFVLAFCWSNACCTEDKMSHFNQVTHISLDKVFVSVYAITETNTTHAKYRTSGEGSSPCFGSNGTLLCGRTLRCLIKL